MVQIDPTISQFGKTRNDQSEDEIMLRKSLLIFTLKPFISGNFTNQIKLELEF